MVNEVIPIPLIVVKQGNYLKNKRFQNMDLLKNAHKLIIVSPCIRMCSCLHDMWCVVQMFDHPSIVSTVFLFQRAHKTLQNGVLHYNHTDYR